MLGGRERVGAVSIDWQRHALGIGTSRRKTVGVGRARRKERTWEFELYLREISIVEGGLGCAVWDAAIVLSRYLWQHRAQLEGKRVLELGSGVGAPGLIAATAAAHVTLTDYIAQVLCNLRYNVRVNARVPAEDEWDADHDDEQRSNWRTLRPRIAERTSVRYLDWDAIERAAPVCAPADVVLGSELTYSPLSVRTLVRVLQYYVRPDGYFFEILSDDRDGVALFVEEARQSGFVVEILEVDPALLGNYGTKQRPESYHFYRLTWRDDWKERAAAMQAEFQARTRTAADAAMDGEGEGNLGGDNRDDAGASAAAGAGGGATTSMSRSEWIRAMQGSDSDSSSDSDPLPDLID